MKTLGVALVCGAVLAGCSPRDRTPPPTETREVESMRAELVAPRGVRAGAVGPTCVLEETTGGEYGKARYTVRLRTAGLTAPADDKRRVFYTLEVEAGGRIYRGYASPEQLRQHESGLGYLPPGSTSERFDLPMAPEGWVGVQEVPGDLQACRLTLRAPDESERALGGMQVRGTDSGEWTVIDEHGTHRSPSLA